MAVCATLQFVTQGAEGGHKLRYREAARVEHVRDEVVTAGEDGSLSWFWRLQRLLKRLQRDWPGKDKPVGTKEPRESVRPTPERAVLSSRQPESNPVSGRSLITGSCPAQPFLRISVVITER